MIINMVGGGAGFSTNSALLHIITYAGSTVSIFKNDILIKSISPEKSHPNNNNNNSNYYYSISSANYGDYTIIATLGELTASQTITIDSNKQYSINLFYALDLIRNGIATSILEVGGSARVTLRNECYHLATVSEGFNTAFITAFIPNLSYTKLILKLTYSSELVYGKSRASTNMPSIGYCFERPTLNSNYLISNVVSALTLIPTTGNITTESFTFDLSSALNRSIWVFAVVGGTTTLTGPGYLNINNFYLDI